MNRLNRLHAEQQEDCSSIWGQQLRRRGHQTESSSVLQEDRINSSIEVVNPKRRNTSLYNSRADTQAPPHDATCSVAYAVRALPARVSASAPALLGVWSRLGLYLYHFLSALFPE